MVISDRKMKKIITIIMSILMLTFVISLTYSNNSEMVRVFITHDGNFKAENGNLLHLYKQNGVIAMEVPKNALNGLKNNPNVLSIEEDVQVSILVPPNKCSPWPSCRDDGTEEPSESIQELPWGVDRIDAELVTETGEGVVVCIIDTGIDKTHEDLKANIAGGVNYVVQKGRINPNSWNDDNGHGTHVAGTVAALDNNVGVVGVAPQASLLIVKALDRRGNGYLSDVIAGIEYCDSNNADIISMSLGSSSSVSAMETAVNNAYSNGVLMVAAAGNDYGGFVSYPAAYSSVIAVSATTSSDLIASYSNIGPNVELSAPGSLILSTWIDGGYNTISGTSMATPHVSGVTALAIAQNPTFNNVQIRNLLITTADDLGTLGFDNYFGFGLVDAQLN